MDQKKRSKGKNFTESEKEILFQIAMKYKDVIENKRSDSSTISQKYLTWSKILEEFNAQQTTGIRELKSIKTLYDNLKMKARKEKHADKVERFKTGGGPNPGNISTLSTRIIGELSTQYEPLENPYDSSSNYYEENRTNIGTEESLLCQEVEVLTVPFDGTIETEDIRTPPQEHSVSIEVSDPPMTAKSNVIDNPPPAETSRKRVLDEISGHLSKKMKYSNKKQDYLEIEHRKRMTILQIEEETARLNKENAILKNNILIMKLNVLKEKNVNK